MDSKYEEVRAASSEISTLDNETLETSILNLQHNYWNQLEMANRITSDEKYLLLDYDNGTSVEDRISLLEERGLELCTLFIKILRGQNPDHIRYVLTLINQVLTADHEQGVYFNDIKNCHDPFFGILTRQSDLTQYESGMACKVLALILSQVDADGAAVDRFLLWLSTSINQITANRTVDNGRSGASPAQKIIPLLMAVKVMLKTPQTLRNGSHHPQVVFVRRNGLQSLVSVFGNPGIAKNTQTLYVCGFCIWLLSFNDRVLDDLKRVGVVRFLVDTVKTVGREKVVRICFSILYNLLSKSESDSVDQDADEDELKSKLEEKKAPVAANVNFAEDMVGQQLHKTVESLMQRKWKDEDILTSLNFVHKKLQIVLQQLSSFEMYAAEIMSGKLRRSPVHTEDFWRNNYKAFEGNSYALIGKLVGFLDAKHDVDTLEMACLDLGEFARFHPDGRSVISHFHGKTRLMALMNHNNTAVAKQALLSVQKIMLTNWEALSKSASTGLSSLGRSARS